MFISNSAEETANFGRQCAAKARAGDVIALAGDLGSGKTQFVKGFVAGIGSDAAPTSPTFTILHEYGWRPSARFIILIFIGWKIAPRRCVLALTIIFLVTAFP